MSVMSVQYIVDSSSVETMLARLDTALSPIALASFLKAEVGPFLRDRAQERFAAEGDDVSGSWAPLEPSTQEIRSRGNWPVAADHPINVRTGELEAYITRSDSAVWDHTLGATLQYPGKKTSRRSIVQKMRTAQSGRSNPRTVARPVLGMNEQDLSFVMGALFTSIQKVTNV